MPAPVLVKVTSATFKAKAIVGAQSASIASAGSAQMARGDGAVTMQIAYVEGIHMRVSVSALQASLTDKDLINPGAGTLVIVGFVQDQGAAHTVTAYTWTFPQATLEGTDRSVPLDGNPAVQFNFVAVAPSGDLADLMSVV